MKWIYMIVLFVFSTCCYAQTGIGKTTADPSAILDLSNSTNKSFLPPRVSIGANLADVTTPVVNPVEGLIVYNTGTAQPAGLYIWNKGVWSLMATKDNSVTNAVVTFPANTAVALGAAGTAVSVTPLATSSLFNGIPGLTYDAGSGTITLPIGQYNIQVVLNISTAETTATGIGSSTASINVHYYNAQLLASSGALGGIISDNVASNTVSGTNGKQHVANFYFTFQLSTPTSFVLNLAHATGGTYTGAITLINGSFIHIQRSTL